MVPDIEKFSSQAQPPVARDLLRFDKRHIETIQPRSSENVPSQIAVSPRQRLRESCRIEIRPQRIERNVRITNQIWAVPKFTGPGIVERQSYVERPARLESRNAIQLPVRSYCVQPTGQMARRYAPCIRNGETMANVEIREAIVAAQIPAVFHRPAIKSAS